MGTSPNTRVGRGLLPSLPDLVFIAMLIWLLAGGNSSALLGDGDTGWHIRNGEQILRSLSVPATDSFAFGSQGHEWFAWEWLADVLFAVLHSFGGMKAVVLFAAVIIAATQWLVMRRCIKSGVNPLLALGIVLIGANASSVHYLARPHLFTLFLLASTALLLESAETAPRRWALAVVAVLWTNLHGGFLALFSLLGGELAQAVLKHDNRRAIFRHGITATVCLLATTINPYGLRLYTHLWRYLGSGAIRESVQEFQSPAFGHESMLCFEVLLVGAIVLSPRMLAQRRIADAMVLLFWAHQSLLSVRHVPIFCVLAVPVIGREIEKLWRSRATRGKGSEPLTILRSIGEDWRPAGWSLGLAPFAVVALLMSIGSDHFWPRDFPAARFPTSIVNRNWSVLTSTITPARVFSSDQWSDYLIYKLYPHVQTFFDGRSDFLLSWRGDDYRALMSGKPGSSGILDREKVKVALLPQEWALAGELRSSPLWRVVDSDSIAVLLARR